MDIIRKWTTPTQSFIIDDVDLTSADVYVTFKQGENDYTFSGDDLTVTYDGTNTTISVALEESFTGGLEEGIVAVQINWRTEGQRDATFIEYIKVMPNLMGEIAEEAEVL